MNITSRIRPIVFCAIFFAFTGAALANERVEEFGSCKDGNPETQIKACTRLIESGNLPKDLLPHAYNNRGMAKTFLGDPEGGLKDFDRTLSLDPLHEHAHLNRGYAHIFMGALDEAKRDFERAIDVSPLSPEPYIGRGLASIMNGEADPAIADLNSAIKFAPKNILAYINRGCAHRMKGDIVKAIADFKKALELDPLDQDAQRNLDDLMMEQKVPSADKTQEGRAPLHLIARQISGSSPRLRYVLRRTEPVKNSIACKDQTTTC